MSWEEEVGEEKAAEAAGSVWQGVSYVVVVGPWTPMGTVPRSACLAVPFYISNRKRLYLHMVTFISGRAHPDEHYDSLGDRPFPTV